MAIWSMGSQTQILIGYLPVPAPLLCKYWTSTFFTVTCIWKKKKESQRGAREGGGGSVVLRTDTVEWICCRGQTLPSLPHYLSDTPPILPFLPPLKSCNQQVHLTPPLALGTSVTNAEYNKHEQCES